MTYYISAKRFYFEHKIKEGGYLAVEDSRFGGLDGKCTRRCRGARLQ